MEDAMRQIIRWRDFVMFKSSAGAHRDRGLVHRLMAGANKLVVQCVDGAEVTQDASDVYVVDRSYLRSGIAVASASDPGGQVGVVAAVSTTLDLVRLDGGDSAPPVVATAVPPARLRRVREFCLGDYVVSGPWLGRVFEVSLDVDVAFDGGAAVCRVTRASSKLWNLNKLDSLNVYTNSAFYPGLRVGGRSSDWKAARWLKGYWKPSHRTGTVCKVETAAVLVYWVASSPQLGGAERSVAQAPFAPPAHQQSPRDLTFFCTGEPAVGFWGVGDRCFFRAPCGRAPAASDVGHPARAPTTKRRRNWLKQRKIRNRRPEELEQLMSVVSGTRTAADVVWQDGTRQRGVPSVSLLPFVARNDHDFIPGERIVASTTVAGAGAGDDDDPARVGVVGSLSYKDEIVRVSWLKAAGEAVEIDCRETLSAYDLRRNDSSCDPFYGDIVVRRQSPVISGDAGGSTEELAPALRNKGKTDNDLSWVGHIVDLCDDARIQVKWGDDNTSKVFLHEIAVVKHQGVSEMLKEIGDWVSEDGDMNNAIGNPQETAAVTNNNDDDDDGEGDDNSDGESDDGDGHEAMRRLGWVGVVTQAVTRLAGKVLAQGRRYLANGSEVAGGSSSELALTENTTTPTPIFGGGNGGVNGGGGSGDDGSTMKENVEADAIGDDKSFHFPRFDVVQSPLDHHYLNNMEHGTNGGRKWTKRVQKEWKILKNNLPDTIFMRAYEDRMDLLRAVMVGASGTPYHDGLFFFDLQLSSSYPTTPPLVNYKCFGLRVNPNLYPSGTVCLSLLNTFGGYGTELWSPEASSVLQVVISIQGLVLNAKPYYNEAGYAVQVGTPAGRRNELPYNENVYLLTLQTMLHLLRRPPAGFEDFVHDHFRHRGKYVLRACQAYMEGSIVGTLNAEACATEGSSERPCSAGFKLALLNVMPRLVEAFAGISTQGRCD